MPRNIYSDTRLSARGVDFEHPNFPAAFAAQKAYGPAFKPLVCTGEDSLAELTARLGTFRPNTAKERHDQVPRDRLEESCRHRRARFGRHVQDDHGGGR